MLQQHFCDFFVFIIRIKMTTENNYYMVDWLKIKVKINHNPEQLNNGLRFDVAKVDSEYTEPTVSYKELWLTEPSYDNKIKIKSLKDDTLLISGNLGKWLEGQNIVGSDDVIKLVYETVIKLSELCEHITPTQQQLDDIQLGYFKINKVDINKAILFNNKDEALQYLERLKFHGSYPRFNKKVENNGVYFGYESERKVIKYYYKGHEIIANNKYQHNLNNDLIELANRMVRCELTLKWRELYDNELLNGYDWNSETVKRLIDDTHNQLRMPEPIKFPTDLPTKYIRFISCFKAGTLVRGYTPLTINRMKRDLMRLHGVDIYNMAF